MSFDYDGALKRAKKKWLYRAAKVIEDDASRNAARNKGQLAGSITSDVGDDEAEVGTNVEHAPHVEYGTRPHSITVNGPVKIKGKWVYLKTVKHPGTKAQPFMRPAIDNNRKSLMKDFQKMLHDEYQKEARRDR